MSTELARHVIRWVRVPLVVSVVACVHRFSSNLEAVCRGDRVGERVTLVVDSVSRDAGDALTRLRGARFDLAVTVLNSTLTDRCEDRSGPASVTADDLPDPLAHATSRTRRAEWLVQGTNIAVNLNPGVVDNNLLFLLPLDGTTGHWSLSTIAGPVASGRLLPVPPN